MINISTLTSILENHKLTDEQSEELQKVIYGLDDRRLAEAKPPFEKADRICIFLHLRWKSLRCMPSRRFNLHAYT